jgi:hypothetical protein
MDNPQLRLIELDTETMFDYYVDEFSNVYRAIKHKPKEYKMNNKHFIDGQWYKKLTPNNRNTKKYWKIELTGKESERIHISIHRLSAKAFIPNPLNLPQVNHIDGNKNNNHISNLEWVSNTSNFQHSMKIGLRKTVDYLLINILLGSSTYTQKEIADIVGCSTATIEKYQSINKVQRPEHYSHVQKIIESRAKLVDTKWYRNGEAS